MANNTTTNTAYKIFLHITTGFLAFESILIIVINLLVFVLFAKFKKLRRKSNYCLVSLALSDFFAGVVVFPLFVICNYADDYLTSCVAFKLIHDGLTCTSIIHLLLATCDRCFKIAYPFRYRTIFTEARIIALLVIIWIVSISVSIAEYPFLYDKIFATTMLVVVAIIPFTIIVALNIYTRWLIASRNKNASNLVETKAKNKDKNKQQKVVCLYLSMAVIAFMMGLLTFFILAIFVVPPLVTLVFAVFKYCVHFVNPLMYTFFKADFRMAFKRMVGNEEGFDQKKRSTSSHSKLSKETVI